MSDPVGLAEAVLGGGCRWLQVRWKGGTEAEVVSLARILVATARPRGAKVLVNDRAAWAVAADADGAHIGPLDGDLGEARAQLGPTRILGATTSTPHAVEAALGLVDYVACGPVWATPHLSRPKPVVGLDGVRQIVACAAGRVPVVAIGGIDAERLPAVRATGVDAWAVVRAISEAPDPGQMARAMA